MDAATAEALMAIAKASETALRRHEPDAEVPFQERYTDIIEALEWHLDRGDLGAARRLACTLVPFWMSTNRIAEGDEWFGRLLAVNLEPDDTLARALHDHGYLVFWAGKYDTAAERFTQSQRVAAELGNSSLEALALAGLARVALNSDVNQAVRLLREALDITQGRPDDEGRSDALHVLGVALQMSGDLEGARDVMSQRLAMAQQQGNAFVVWTELANLSMVERQLGNLDKAEELSRQAVATDTARSRQLYLAWTLNGLGAVTAAKGELTRAATIVGIAAAMLERAGGEWPPDEREQYHGTLETIKRGLTQEQVAVAREKGAVMSRNQALSYALAVGPDG